MFQFKDLFQRFYKTEQFIRRSSSGRMRKRRRKATQNEADEMFATNYFCGGILKHNGL